VTRLFEEFPPVSTAEWEAQIARDLGRDANRLHWVSADGIEGKPFYRSEDLGGGLGRELYSSNAWKVGCEVADVESARYAIARGAAALYIEKEFDLGGVPLDGIEVIRAGSGGLWRAEGNTPVQELASVLAGPSADLLEFAVGADYFLEIAKFRAARLLRPGVRILARTTKRNLSIYDPYVNLLRGTTEAMSAIIGGCDILVVRPFDAAYENPGEFSRRLSINTQLILREEALLDRIPDPAAGCWYLEWLTDQLVAKTWELHQGHAAVAGVAAVERDRIFVGVNKYEEPSDRALDRLAIEPDEDRDVWPFEKERLAAERGSS
jgi:hypothetical protein